MRRYNSGAKQKHEAREYNKHSMLSENKASILLHP